MESWAVSGSANQCFMQVPALFLAKVLPHVARLPPIEAVSASKTRHSAFSIRDRPCSLTTPSESSAASTPSENPFSHLGDVEADAMRSLERHIRTHRHRFSGGMCKALANELGRQDSLRFKGCRR